ncbi:MAG: baseplate J/gp47 family protein [Anaerolineae bacterium]
MTTQVIHLEVDDDITAVRARLEKAEASRVLLMVPPGCQAFNSLLDFKLLQRYAESLALEVALVTNSSQRRVLARQLGFSVFVSAGWGQRRSKWRRPKATPRWGKRRSWGERIFGAFVFLVALSALLAVALLIVPSAEITLVLANEAVDATVQVQADPELDMIDYQAGQIPARVMQAQIEGTAQIPVSGTKDAPDEPARGLVFFINNINQPVTVPKGTVIATSTGSTIRFTTVEEVIVQGTVGAVGEVEVVAIDPGPSGNVRANLINMIEGPLSLQVRVTNPEPMQGGSVKQVGMVTTADQERLKDVLLQQLQQAAYSQLGEGLEEGEFLASESVAVDHIVTEEYDKPVEEQADVLTLEMEVMFRGTAVEEENANALTRAALEAVVPEGFALASQDLQYQRGEIADVEDGKVSFVMKGAGSVVAQVDEGDIKDAIRGKPLDFAQEYLSQNLRLEEAPVIEVTPTWPGRIPWFGFRINISSQEE